MVDSTAVSPVSAQYAQHRKSVGRSLSRDRRRRKQKRLVYKNGDYNLAHANVSKRRQRFLVDIFTTMLDIQWRWILLMFVIAFLGSWLAFGLIWWLISFTREDLKNYGNSDWTPCVEEVKDFTTALLYSIETQHTIGYGGRAVTSHCAEAVIVLMTQSLIGVIIQALVTGIVFAKLSRSKKRAQTLLFSKNAIISKRDGQLCLLIRLGDMRKTHLIDAHCRGILIKKRVTREGEVLPLYQYEVNFGRLDSDNKLFLVWPITVEHLITETSPFWEMSPESFSRDRFELVVILEGTVGSTGTTAQARTSYLPGEIIWGRRFETLVTLQKENGEYKIDYSLFHSILPMNIPHCSAKELEELQQQESVGLDEADLPSRGSSSLQSAESEQQPDAAAGSNTNLIVARSISTQTLVNDVNSSDDDSDASFVETFQKL